MRTHAPGRWTLVPAGLLGLAMGAAPHAHADAPPLFAALGTTVPESARAAPIPAGLSPVPADAGWSDYRKQLGLADDDEAAVRSGRFINRRLPAAAQRFGDQGYVPFVPDFMDLVFPASVPRGDQISDTVHLQAPPGELETAALAIHALKALQRVELVAGDFKDADGRTVIPAAHIDLRSAWYMPRLAWRAPRYTLRPIILEKGRALDIAAAQSQLYYVCVHVPATTPPGTCTSQVTISAASAPPATVELSLTVLPFALAEPDTLYAFWYHADRVSPEYLYKDLLAMRGCGMNSVMLTLGDLEKGDQLGVRVHRKRVWDADEVPAVRLDFSALVAFMAKYKQAGFTKPVVYNLVLKEILELSRSQFGDLLRQMNALARDHDWPGFIWSIGDENDASPESLARARALLALVNEAVPDDLTKNTIVYPKNAGIYGSDLDIQVWAGYFDGTLIEPTLRVASAMGMYNGTGSYETDARDNRFFYGVWTWAIGFKHIEQWVYNHALYDADRPFDDLSHGARNAGRGNCHYYCYPGPDGPLPTVGYYGIRAGIDDARYLYTLEQQVKAAVAAADDPEPPAPEATRFLSRWRARIDLAPPPEPMAYFVVRREAERVVLSDYRKLRREAARLIIDLQARAAAD